MIYDSDDSPRNLNPSIPVLSPSVILSSQQRKAALAIGLAGLVSCVLVSIILLYLAVSAILWWRQRRADPPVPFIRKDIAIFVVCLFVADLSHSIAGALELKWVQENRVYEGITCTAQATLISIGDLGSPTWRGVIAAYTFSCIALRRQWSRTAIYTITIAGWVFVGIMTAVGPTALELPSKRHFFGIAGPWCSVTAYYYIQRLGVKYVPWLIAAVVISVCYILVFLFLRGSISFLRGIRSDDANLPEREVIAKRMLWYPAGEHLILTPAASESNDQLAEAFLACTYPITIIRLIGVRDHNIPLGVWAFGVFCIQLVGAVDSVIYVATRGLIQPHRAPVPLHSLGSDTSPSQTNCSHYTCPDESEFNHFGPSEEDCILNMPAYTPWDTRCPSQARKPEQ